MDKFEPPSCLRFEGNLSENWQEFKLYLTATEKDGKSDKIKTSILLTCIGKQGWEIYNTFQFEEGDDMKFNIVLQKFQEYCSPRKNITFMRHKFFTCNQREGQTFDEFVALSTRIRIRLYPQTFCCGFKSLRVHTYPDSLRFRASTRFRENDTNTPDLLTEHALSHVMNPRCC